MDMPHQEVFIADSLENSTQVSDLKKYVTVRFLTKNGIWNQGILNRLSNIDKAIQVILAISISVWGYKPH